MKDIKNIADFTGGVISENKIEKYAYLISESEKREFNAANGDFSLFRTVFGQSISVTAFDDGKKGSASGNDLSEEGISATVATALSSAKSSEKDDAHDIAEKQDNEVFHKGVYEPDMGKFFERYKELLEDVAKEFPKINVMEGIASHTKGHSIYRNSNGTEFEVFSGAYDFMIEFVAVDGEKTTSIDGAGVSIKNLDTKFIELGDIRKRLEDCQKSLDLIEINDKFEGTVVFTPDCFSQFVSYTVMNYASGTAILDGTSRWLDKVGEKVASDKLSIYLDPYDERITTGERITDDGYKSEKVTFIENGVLNQFLLSLYIANKTGKPVTKNSGGSLIITPGEKSLEEIISGIDKGLLVGGFSGGTPGVNGEFSGVAKHSFYIENGKIAGAVTETMINGNLGEIMENITDISKEVLQDGYSVVPYVAASGIVISGKN